MLASSSGKNVSSNVSITFEVSPKPSQTTNSGATAIFGTSWMKTSSGYSIRFAVGDSAISRPSGMAVTTDNPKPRTISWIVTDAMVEQALTRPSQIRGSTSSGGGSRNAGTLRIATAAHQAAISAMKTQAGSVSRTTRQMRPVRRRLRE